MKAAIIRIGDKEQVSPYLSNHQNLSSMAGLPDGGWLVTWAIFSGPDTGIYQQRYNAQGQAVGPHSQVDPGQTYVQSVPLVIVLADGGWVVTWASPQKDGNPDRGDTGIYQQRFNAQGEKIGQSTQVDTPPSGKKAYQSAAALPDGGWLIAWRSLSDQDGFGRDIYQQRFNAKGEAVGGEVRVNTRWLYDQENPSVTALPDGGWLIAWRSINQDKTSDIFQQRYNAAGEAVGGETLVSSGGYLISAVVTMLADGGWIVTWTALSETDGGSNIYQQRYNKNGQPDAKGEEKVNTTTGTNIHLTNQSVKPLADGGWVVIWWLTERNGSEFANYVYQQSYDKDGNAVGPEIMIDTGTPYIQYPSLTALADGSWVVAWTSSPVAGSPDGILQRRFKSVEAFGEGKERGTGTSGNDLFKVLDHGLGAGDSLEAGAGTDTLRMIEAGTLDLTAPDVLTGIEIVVGSNLNDVIIANEERIAGIREFRGGGGYDSLQLKAGDYDFINKSVADIMVIMLLGKGSITFSSKAMALRAHSHTNDGAVTLTEGRFTIAERTKLYNQGIREVRDEGGVYNLQQAQASLSTNGVTENALAGTVIATLSATDPNPGDGLRYELIDNAGGRFALSGNHLVVADSSLLDYETGASHRIVVRIIDEGGIMTDAAFTITLNDVPVEIIKGTSRADKLKGGMGQDILYGGKGKDTLTGDAGQDIFVFDTKPNKKTNLDKITDFSVSDDSIWLENKIFKKLGKKGTEEKPALLKKAFFTIGTKAKDKNDYIIYDNKKGVLYYDADGSGEGQKVEIATLSKKLKMTHKDFFVI